MMFTFKVVSLAVARQTMCRVKVCSASRSLGELEMTPNEWVALRRLVGSGAIEAANAGINCEIEED